VADLLQDRRRALVAAVVVVLALALAGRAFLRPSHASAPPPPIRPTGAAAPAKPNRVYVDVVGAVRRPGLYRVPSGARVADAVAHAGGPTRKADLQLVNLAALVADGEQVVVPKRGSGGPGAAAAAPGSAPTGPVHLNSATLEQLDALPGVGPVTAQKIIDYRTQHGGFDSADELDAVPGIGPARLADLRPLVAP
jgi:competence protein ComEA